MKTWETFKNAGSLVEAVNLIGSIVLVVSGEFEIECRIIDVRSTWGDFNYECAPVAGRGTQWLTSRKISAIEAKEVAA